VAQLAWIKRIRQRTRRCPSCPAATWIAAGANEPTAQLLDPDSPIGHPEHRHSFDGKLVVPVTCQHCGFVAIYSVQHLESVSPWE
jgi:hypothetical protein